MKKMLVMVLLLTALFTIGASAKASAAKKVGTPRVTSVKYAYTPKGVTGAYYRLSWTKVRGADGYQYSYGIKENRYDSYYDRKVTTKKTSAVRGWGIYEVVRVRARAYKIVNGKKKFGKWSKYYYLRY